MDRVTSAPSTAIRRQRCATPKRGWRISPTELLQDIEKDTVDWIDNFDGSLQEPTVLPARVPNLLVNGASGIAVGMATNIPPHNLGEIVDALVHILDNWDRRDEIGVEELMEFVKGPDFPTGGQILGHESIIKAYATGRGKAVVRAVANIEEMRGGRFRIVVTEIPYQLNKTSLLERIAAARARAAAWTRSATCATNRTSAG